ncbi:MULTISPECIES: hypothetical protein [unclassified Variovorax]|uniref:hypothetical protein n=1 Tax=unclassified Variovorax TaxID=663243 RepID=UPI0034E8CAE6
MNASWIHREYRIALVDSDALQRICTSNSLSVLGADNAPFGRMSELVAAIRAGHQFDAVIVGIHADAAKTISELADVEDAAGRPLPVLYVAHHTELQIVHRLPAQVLAQESFRLLPSPVDEDALIEWLNALDRRDGRDGRHAGIGFLRVGP